MREALNSRASSPRLQEPEAPGDAFWYPCLPGIRPCTPEVKVIKRNGIDFAVIPITVTKNTQVP
jgi:hypothetical protein